MYKLPALKAVLLVAALYYVLGALTHWFGLSLFPFFDSNLYTPYQDSVIALCALVFAGLLVVVARNPMKNVEVLNFIIVSATVASLFSIAIIWKVDFSVLGAPTKKLQTITEGILGFAWVVVVCWLHPGNNTYTRPK